MAAECLVMKLLKAYPVDYTLLAEDMSEEDVNTLCALYSLEEGEVMLAFYGGNSLRSYQNGVVMTDRRLVAGRETLQGVIPKIEGFTWEDLRFVMDDIKTHTLSSKVNLPDGRNFAVNLSSGKFHELMKKVAPALESFQGEVGIRITKEAMEKGKKEKADIEQAKTEKRDKEIAGNFKIVKWFLVVMGVLVVFSWIPNVIGFLDKVSGSMQSQGDFTDREICRAGIALTSNKTLAAVEFNGASNEYYRFSYVRPLDKTRWSFRCKVEGNRVVWATANGPWRTRDSDWPITWRVSDRGNVLALTEDYGDGSANFKKYSKSDF